LGLPRVLLLFLEADVLIYFDEALVILLAAFPRKVY
jgi:hypothetical protein